MRAVTATVTAVVSLVAVWGGISTARAEVHCGDDHPGVQPAATEEFRERYDSSVATPLTNDLAAYHTAVASGDPMKIGDSAGRLYSEILIDRNHFERQNWFGCYDPTFLTSVEHATDTLSDSYGAIDTAATSMEGNTPADVPKYVAQASTQEPLYIDALNAYASQFGGQQVPRP